MTTDWIPQVMGFSAKMLRRMTDKELEGWGGFENISQTEYNQRAIKNIHEGNYVDAANLCMLAFMVGARKEK